MEIGRRVLIPASFNFSENYKEMRKIGTYPDVLPYAVVLAYLENAPAVSESYSAISKLLPDEVFRYPQVLSTSAEISNRLESPNFAEEFVAKCNEFFERSNIPLVADASLSNIRKLCSVLKLKIDLQMGYLNQEVGESRNLVVGIGVFKRTCFLLDKNVNRESFIILPCGHVQLRYNLMKLLQETVQNRAISAYDQISVKICEECDLTYSQQIFEFIELLSQGKYPRTLSPQLPPFTPSYLVCFVCNRRIDEKEILMFCKCSNTVCYSCAVIERICDPKICCPACSEYFPNPAQLDFSLDARANIKPVLPSRRVKTRSAVEQIPAKKKCHSCSQEYVLSHYLDIGDHLNCWVCVGCVESDLRRGNCPHCKEVYNSDAVGIQRIMKEREKPIEPVNQSASAKAPADASIPEEYKTVSFKPERNTKVQQSGRPVTCSKCKAPTQTTDCHKCEFDKYVCVDCCITDVVTKFTSIANCCSTCRNKFEPHLEIDMESQTHPCGTCGKHISLLEAVHRCSDLSIRCADCIGFTTDSAPKTCSTCKKAHYDKHKLKRGQK